MRVRHPSGGPGLGALVCAVFRRHGRAALKSKPGGSLALICVRCLKEIG